MRRHLVTLGLGRRMKQVPSLQEYLRERGREAESFRTRWRSVKLSCASS